MCYLPTAAEYLADMLVVREDWLRGYLASQGLALVFAVSSQSDHQEGQRAFSWTKFSLSGAYHAEVFLAGAAQIMGKSTARVS